MVPGGSPHRRQIVYPPPPRNRVRQTGSAAGTGNGHEDKGTGRGPQRDNEGKPGEGRAFPCSLEEKEDGQGWEGRGKIAMPTGAGERHRWKDGPKSSSAWAGDKSMWLVPSSHSGHAGPTHECRVWGWRNRVRTLGRRFSYEKHSTNQVPRFLRSR